MHFLIHMLRGLRDAILDDRVEPFVREFYTCLFKYEEGGVPQWIHNALAVHDITL